MLYGLLAVSLTLAAALVLTVRWALSAVENTVLLAVQERDALNALHAEQLSEFANRIQIPDRAAHMSISTLAPDSEPFVNPEIEEELSIVGEG